jgi:methyl-accepting chemotaxis protein
MVASLNSLVVDLAGAGAQVGSASHQMADTSGEAGRAIGEIAEAIAGVATGSERQLRLVETAKASTDETAQAADEARRVSDDGVSAAGKAYDAMESVRRSSTDVTAAIHRLSAASEQIGGIVGTITDIAAETNLLALNAAIEAARAGEQGRGFAVVAEQVRALADQSQRAAATIGSLVAHIQKDTQSAVAIVEDGSRRSEEGVVIAEEARTAFAQIGRTVGEVSDRVGRIVEAMDEVEVVAEQATASTAAVSASTEQTSASTQEIASSAQELATTAEELGRLVARFRVAA